MRRVLVGIGMMFAASAGPQGISADEALSLPPALESVAEFQAHKGIARTLAFSADGRLLISGGSDRSLRYWSVGRYTESKRYVLPRGDG